MTATKRTNAPAKVRKPTQEEMNRTLRTADRRIQKALLAYATGQSGGARQFAETLQSILEERHARAAALGRQLGGDRSPQSLSDSLYAKTVMQRERTHLLNFVEALVQGRYNDEDGNPKVSQILRRARMYTGRIVGTANDTFVMASARDATFTWVLGAVEKHCSACPSLAKGSPYTAKELPTKPHRNETPCLMNCKCYLVRSDGVEGFRGVNDNG